MRTLLIPTSLICGVLLLSACATSGPNDEEAEGVNGVNVARNAVGGLFEGIGRSTTRLADATEDAMNNPQTARDTATEIGSDGFGEAVAAPLTDFNLRKRETPELLLNLGYVYAHSTTETDEVELPDCDAIAAEIADLDTVLGYDYDVTRETEDGEDFGSGAGSAFLAGVEGATTFFIPFRGAVREVSGAASEERARTQAYVNGISRRAHLKGLGLGLGCDVDAKPVSVEAPVVLRVDRNGVPYDD